MIWILSKTLELCRMFDVSIRNVDGHLQIKYTAHYVSSHSDVPEMSPYKVCHLNLAACLSPVS